MVVKRGLRRSGSSRLRMVVIGLVAAAVVATACSSSKSSSSSATTAAGGPPTSNVLGTPNAATGTPVKIGYMTEGKGQQIDNSSEIPAAQAAVQYSNAYLGGIGGHPISLDICDTKQTPAGTTDCNNQMITDKVPIVLDNVSSAGPELIKNIAAAGIPLMAYTTSVQAVLTSPDAYVLTNGVGATFAGSAAVAQKVGAKHGALFVIDVPAAAGAAKALYPIIWKNAGIPTIDIIPIAPGTADMTPQVQAELTKNPDLIQVLGDVTFCSSALKAMKTLGYAKTVVVIPQCITSTSAAGIPGGYAGMTLTTVYSTDRTDPENQLYIAGMSKYASGTDPYANGVTSGGWAVVMGLVRSLKALTGDVTTANIKSTLAAMAPTPLPLAPNVMFQCTGKQIVITPAVCSTSALEATLNQQGQAQGGYSVLDTTALLKLS